MTVPIVIREKGENAVSKILVLFESVTIMGNLWSCLTSWCGRGTYVVNNLCNNLKSTSANDKKEQGTNLSEVQPMSLIPPSLKAFLDKNDVDKYTAKLPHLGFCSMIGGRREWLFYALSTRKTQITFIKKLQLDMQKAFDYMEKKLSATQEKIPTANPNKIRDLLYDLVQKPFDRIAAAYQRVQEDEEKFRDVVTILDKAMIDETVTTEPGTTVTELEHECLDILKRKENAIVELEKEVEKFSKFRDLVDIAIKIEKSSHAHDKETQKIKTFLTSKKKTYQLDQANPARNDWTSVDNELTAYLERFSKYVRETHGARTEKGLWNQWTRKRLINRELKSADFADKLDKTINESISLMDSVPETLLAELLKKIQPPLNLLCHVWKWMRICDSTMNDIPAEKDTSQSQQEEIYDFFLFRKYLRTSYKHLADCYRNCANMICLAYQIIERPSDNTKPLDGPSENTTPKEVDKSENDSESGSADASNLSS